MALRLRGGGRRHLTLRMERALPADGTVSIYAQKGTKPLWISLKPSVAAPGTTYTMIGATVDSTKADSGR